MRGQDVPSINLGPVFNELRLEGSLTDAVLKVGGVEFLVYTVVLCAHTEYSW